MATPDQIRRDALASLPRWYSPWAHLMATTVFGVGVAVLAFGRVHALRPWEVVAALLFLVLSNASEWRIHKGLLHTRSRVAPLLYDRHTPEHHVIFTTDDMAVRSAREFYLVLIPPYGIVLALLATLPLFAALWLFGLHNLAALFCGESMLYIVTYEWAHLAFHLRPQSWVGRRRLVQVLRRNHAIHHDPKLMQKWNFNIVVPLWDVVRRTYVKDRAAAVAGKS